MAMFRQGLGCEPGAGQLGCRLEMWHLGVWEPSLVLPKVALERNLRNKEGERGTSLLRLHGAWEKLQHWAVIWAVQKAG